MPMQKRFQLDPMKNGIVDLNTLNGTATNTLNYSQSQQSSTKKFLTRKPQTKILNRVFSSKADVKPNKINNLLLKNVPQTANSQQTTSSPLFLEDNNTNSN